MTSAYQQRNSPFCQLLRGGGTIQVDGGVSGLWPFLKEPDGDGVLKLLRKFKGKEIIVGGLRVPVRIYAQKSYHLHNVKSLQLCQDVAM
jgi:hypothetical protein